MGMKIVELENFDENLTTLHAKEQKGQSCLRVGGFLWLFGLRTLRGRRLAEMHDGSDEEGALRS